MRLLLCAVLPLLLAAAEPRALRDCRPIAAAVERLACYDALADATAPVPAAAPAPLAPAAAPPDPVAEFGAEDVKKGGEAAGDGEVDAIRARIVGRFEGWEKNTTFTLDNGQVWRVVDSRTAYFVSDNPAVEIRRGLFGGYLLKVEGLNQQAQVRRLR